MERLLKQIGTFMSEIADEFKIVVVEAIRSLCLKFPQKYRALMNFLSTVRPLYRPSTCPQRSANAASALIEHLLVLRERCRNGFRPSGNLVLGRLWL